MNLFRAETPSSFMLILDGARWKFSLHICDSNIRLCVPAVPACSSTDRPSEQRGAGPTMQYRRRSKPSTKRRGGWHDNRHGSEGEREEGGEGGGGGEDDGSEGCGRRIATSRRAVDIARWRNWPPASPGGVDLSAADDRSDPPAGPPPGRADATQLRPRDGPGRATGAQRCAATAGGGG